MDRAFLRFDLASRAGLCAYLAIQARVVPGLEAAAEVGGAARLLPDWPLRRRSQALAHDLRELGAAWPDDPVPAVPPADDAETLGVIYVLEVSRLGAAALARRAARSDDPAVRAAVRFLAHGEGRLWSDFVQRLDAHPFAQERPDRLAGAALAAFAAFEVALDEAP